MPATKSSAQHSAEQAANATFLQYASSVPQPAILGSIASGSSGGSESPVVWAREIPVAPRWLELIELYVKLPYSITVPAGATVYVSPFAPYSVIQNRLTIAGSPPWDQISLVPFYLDFIARRQNFDLSYPGPVSTANGGAAQQDDGTWSFDMGNTSLVPGQAITNSGTAAETITGTLQFTGLIQLQRRRHAMFGMIPNGNSDDRPDLELQLSPLVGPQPENSLIQDPSASGATASLTAAGTVIAVYRGKSLDVLPSGVAVPNPIVGLGWSINSYTTSVQNAGQVFDIKHRAAMLDQYFWHIVVNDQQPIDADYFGLWLTGESQNARWQYDSSLNNMQSYWQMIQRHYGRYLPKGVFVADLVGGEIPELPGETPFMGAMSPDESYATAFGVKYTPAQATALRIPTGTTMNGAYIRTYASGYVEVPY